MSNVELELTGRHAGRLVVDGHDLSRATHSLAFQWEANGQPSRLQVGLWVHDTTRIGAENVEVHLDPTAAAWLERAGWTPPPGTTSALKRDAHGCPCERKDVSVHDADPDTVLGRVVPTCPVHGVDQVTPS